jgi:hypothetical protein
VSLSEVLSLSERYLFFCSVLLYFIGEGGAEKIHTDTKFRLNSCLSFVKTFCVSKRFHAVFQPCGNKTGAPFLLAKCVALPFRATCIQVKNKRP